tara:strand:+ start:228 stop:566 length:339 start_codon:yes stop_codon:yes gene_type:complete
MDLTQNEIKMLIAFVKQGKDCIRAETSQDIIEDNMAIMSVDDFKEEVFPELSRQAIGGIMGSLSTKRLAGDSTESPRADNGCLTFDGRKPMNDWYPTDTGIKIGWQLMEALT